MLLLMMFLEINRLICEITIELSALGKVYKVNEISNCRLKLLNSIKQTMQQHRKDMKRISQKHKQIYNAHELELKNKEDEEAEEVRLEHIRNYISYRNEHNNILNKDLKLMYDTNINNLTENIQHIYMEINKLNDHYNNISQAHSAAVQHAVRQAIKQDEMRIDTYNQKKYEQKFLVDELIRICNLEQSHIMQVTEFNHHHAYTAYQQTAYQQANYHHTAYLQTVNNNLTYPYTTFQQNMRNNTTKEKLEKELEQKLELELELEQELKQKLDDQQFIITSELLDVD
jgi:hypothetical protein